MMHCLTDKARGQDNEEIEQVRHLSRRKFVGGVAGASASFLLPPRAFAADTKFKVGVISDEISQDFDHACYVIAKDFGLYWVELREGLGKNLQVIPYAP